MNGDGAPQLVSEGYTGRRLAHGTTALTSQQMQAVVGAAKDLTVDAQTSVHTLVNQPGLRAKDLEFIIQADVARRIFSALPDEVFAVIGYQRCCSGSMRGPLKPCKTERAPALMSAPEAYQARGSPDISKFAKPSEKRSG